MFVTCAPHSVVSRHPDLARKVATARSISTPISRQSTSTWAKYTTQCSVNSKPGWNHNRRIIMKIDKNKRTKTSSGFYVSQHASVNTDNPIPTPKAEAPDVLRVAYMELQVTDLAASRKFYVDVLGLHVSHEDDNEIYLRSSEEFIHHNLLLKKGPVAAVGAFSYRVRSPEDVDKAEAFYKELGCRTERRKDGFVEGIGDSVRVEDPLGFPYEFFYEVDHMERLAWRYDLHVPGALVRLDHFNQVTPDVPRAAAYMQDLGFRVTEEIADGETVYAAWMRRKP